MISAHRATAAALFLLGGVSLAAAPMVNGIYKASELGLWEVKNDGTRLSADQLAGGPCDLEPGRRVLEGQFEGQVVVGRVLLCQTGPGCGERMYSFLGFYSAEAGTLVADLGLQPGCQVPGLGPPARLVLRLATAEERAPLGRGPHSAQSAKRRSDPKKLAELSTAALLKATELLNAGDFAGAAHQFELGISYDPDNWIGYMGLGVAEFKRDHVLKAIGAYERARELGKDGREAAQNYVNLACAHSRLGDRRAALENLKQGVKLGFDDPEHLSADPDLNRLFRGDPEFDRLVKQAADSQERGKAKHGKF